MDSEHVIAPIAPKEPTDSTASYDGGITGGKDINYLQLQNFFGVETPDSGEMDTMNEIYGMLEGTSETFTDMLLTIRNIEMKMGAPNIGVSRIINSISDTIVNSEYALDKSKKLANALGIYGIEVGVFITVTAVLVTIFFETAGQEDD